MKTPEHTTTATATEVERQNIMERIWAHYDHAREKHLYFCDRLLPYKDLSKYQRRGMIAGNLELIRYRIDTDSRNQCLAWNTLVDCEEWEAIEAILNGDYAHAVEECYDTIAVLLRTIDVLEGRQKLGKPETKGETK